MNDNLARNLADLSSFAAGVNKDGVDPAADKPAPQYVTELREALYEVGQSHDDAHIRLERAEELIEGVIAALEATEDVIYDDRGYSKTTGVDKDGFAPPRAAFDLLRLKLTSEGAATVLGACLTAAATTESEGAGGYRIPSADIVDRAFDLLRHIERTIR